MLQLHTVVPKTLKSCLKYRGEYFEVQIQIRMGDKEEEMRKKIYCDISFQNFVYICREREKKKKGVFEDYKMVKKRNYCKISVMYFSFFLLFLFFYFFFLFQCVLIALLRILKVNSVFFLQSYNKNLWSFGYNLDI